MEEILKLLLMQKKKKNKKEECPACETNLYLNDKYSRKIGILDDERDEVLGWTCPYCNAQFDLDNKIMYIKGIKNGYGRA